MDRSKAAYTASYTVTLAVWWMSLLWGLADCMTVRQTSTCLYSRLDFYPCNPQSYTSTPGANEYAEYRTRIRYFVTDCIYRNPNISPLWEIIRPIDTLGNPNVRLLYSPGFTSNEAYKNELLVSYNVQCPAGRLPFLTYTHLDLQPADCFGFCEDYLTVSCTDCGTSESCGTEPTDNYYPLEEEQFTVTFRSSESERYSGFELSVICFDPMETSASDDGDDDTSVSRRKRHLDGLLKVWQKRAAHIQENVVLADPEVVQPPLTTETPRLRFLTLNITLGNIVTYAENVVVVKRRDQVINRIRNIRRLSVHNRNGDDRTFVSKAVMWNEFGEKTLKQLRGVGQIVVLSDEAYFFRYYESIEITSQEREVLKSLSAELFDLIPEDNSDDFEDEPEDYEYDEYVINEPSTIHRDVPPPPLPRRLVSMSAIQTSIAYETSSNPVIRAAVASIMGIADQQDSTRVAMVRRRIKEKENPELETEIVQ